MNVYRKWDCMLQHRTQLAFKGKGEHKAEVNIPNMTYTNQHLKIELPHGLRDLVIVTDTIKVSFNLHIESTDKRGSNVKSEGSALAKRKVLMLCSKEVDRINNLYIYETLKELYLSRE